MKLSVLMPVYNESRTLRTIVERVLEAPIDVDLELVCIDDCSTDNSLEILHDLARSDARIRVHSQPVNLGKGRALRTAIQAMTGDIAIIQDADLEYDPRDYAKVIAPLLSGDADVVYGSRFASSDQRRVLFFWHAFGNRILTTLSNMANDFNLTDMETCYKAFRADVLKRLRLTSDRFGFEPEVTARLAQWGAKVYEVPISYHGRTYAEGKNIGWQDGLEAVWLIVKFRFFDTRATEDDSVTIRQSLGKAPKFRVWVLEKFAPYLGDRVLEVNAGPGHTTKHLLNRSMIFVTDSDAVHAETIERRFGHMANLEVGVVDFATESEFDGGSLDSAIVFDGLQREVEPKLFLANVASTLDSGGHVLIQVPAHADLYGVTDEAAGHRRRFGHDELEDVIRAAGLEVIKIEEFNRVGAYAWRLNHGRTSGRITPFASRLFNLLVPLLRRLDGVLPGRGLTWLAVARVP